MPRFSVVICCANVGDTLQAACESVRWADELVIVDSGSTDNTAEIARRFAHRYIVEPWRGYTGQKKFGAGLARNPWVLVLDGDEECSPQLAAELQAMSDETLDGLDLLLVRRRNWMMGRTIRSWWPDWQSRVIQRDRATWADEALHDRREVQDARRVRRLKGWLEHRRASQGGFLDYFNGQMADQRLALIAEDLYKRGKRATWLDLLFRPAMAFVKFYFLKRGFLDGVFGFLVAQKAAQAVQLKYAALWAAQNGVAMRGKQRAAGANDAKS